MSANMATIACYCALQYVAPVTFFPGIFLVHAVFASQRSARSTFEECKYMKMENALHQSAHCPADGLPEPLAAGLPEPLAAGMAEEA